MTGFGSAEGPVAGGRLQVDIRTVNHRHFNAQLKLPSAMHEIEAQLREVLRGSVHRGHTTLTARWTEDMPRESHITVNVDRARDVVAVLQELKETLRLEGEIDVGFVARQPEVLAFAAGDAPDVPGEEVVAIVVSALEALVEARQREGSVLAAEVGRLLDVIEAHLSIVEERAPARLTAERDRLQRSVTELLNGKPVTDDRLAQEIALLADKLDITEEIVRLRAHLSAAQDALQAGHPVGKQLSFLGQEMLREVNTIGSKANHAPIAHEVIAMKGELEKFREQIENLE